MQTYFFKLLSMDQFAHVRKIILNILNYLLPLVLYMKIFKKSFGHIYKKMSQILGCSYCLKGFFTP